MALTSPSRIVSLLQEHNLHLSKRLGQHFLADANVLAKIVRAAELAPDDAVLEIGAGLGTLTVALASAAGRVAAVEVDGSLARILRDTVSGCPEVEVIHSDMLRLDLERLLDSRPGRWKVVANLPYSITSPAIARLLQHKAKIARMILMVQKEVAERLLAKRATPEYGSISVLVQAHAAARRVMNVSRMCFFPRPTVDSTVVRLDTRRPSLVRRSLEDTFERVLRAAFGQRRKTLLNALAAASPLGLSKEAASEALAAASLDPMKRAESLSPAEFIALARAVDGIGEG